MLTTDSALQRQDARLSANASVSEMIEQATGLSSTEARLRLSKFGPNEPATTKRSAPFFQLFLLFANPLVIILLAASAIFASLGQVVNASIIAMMVLLSVALNFIQTYRSQKAVDRIRKEVAPTASVLRDGKWVEIERREVVPGDVIRLGSASAVPRLGGEQLPILN